MKSITIWSVLIFTASCIALYASGTMPTGEESAKTEVEISSKSAQEIEFGYQKMAKILLDDKETMGNSYASSINK